LIERSRLNYRGCRTPSEVNEYNPSNVRREAKRNLRKKGREYLKEEINDLETN
jgi:hypothetical protein